jgi:hypothetical protein
MFWAILFFGFIPGLLIGIFIAALCHGASDSDELMAIEEARDALEFERNRVQATWDFDDYLRDLTREHS